MSRLRTRAVPLLLPALGLLAACLGTEPEEREPAVQGDFNDGNSDHRPGQPCILCHTDDGPLIPIAPAYALGGTVYDEIDAAATDGLANVYVMITDDVGHEMEARSNRAGNFYIVVDEGLTEPAQYSGGKLIIPWPLSFPLRTSIRKQGVETPMETLIWRARSCATCHGEVEARDSVGRVFLDEEAVP